MCYDPYISISQTDVEKEIKLALGLNATLDIDVLGGGYVPVLEALEGAGTPRSELRIAALDGIYHHLKRHSSWLRCKVTEYMEEQARLESEETARVIDEL